MNFFEAIILGVIQGVTEWLPISSEGVTSLVMVNFLGKAISEAIPFSIWLHTGTLFAALLYFREDVKEIIKGIPEYIKGDRKESQIGRVITFLLVSTFFTGVIGLPIIMLALKEIRFSGEYATALIGVFLIITGILQRHASERIFSDKKIEVKDGILVGIIQAFSAMPGLSRSGLTISALLIMKHDAKEALKLSFLMSIPVVFIAEIGLALIGEVKFELSSLIAIITSFIIGFLTIGTLIKIAIKINFWKFCLFLGVLSFIPLLILA